MTVTTSVRATEDLNVPLSYVSDSGVRSKSARHYALLEQGLISGSNFLLYIYAARILPKEEWGALSFALASLLLLQGFQRAFVTLPMITSGELQGSGVTSLFFWRQLQGWVTGLTLLVICVFILLSSFAFAGWVTDSAILTAALVVPLYYLEFARRVVIITLSMRRLLMMAIAYSVSLLLLVLIAYELGIATQLKSLVAAMIVASVVSCLASRVALLPTRGQHQSGNWTPSSILHFGRWAAASSLAYSGYNFAVQAILATIAGPGALGAFAAARNFTQPIGTLIQAMDSVDKPRAGHAHAKSGMSGLLRVIRQSWLWLLVLSLPYLIAVSFFSPQLLELIYGEKYADASLPVSLWCLVMIAMIVTQPIETGLYVLRRPDWLFFGRATAAILVLIVTPWLVIRWTATGALIALATGWGLAGLFASIQLLRARSKELA